MYSKDEETVVNEKDFLVFENITKYFSSVKVLDQVNCTIKKGEVHALVGENGAGKSTLVKILAGVYPTPEYSGTIYIEGKSCDFRNIRHAEEAGVCIIYQELELIPSMSVSENIFLGNEPENHGIINHDKMYRDATILLNQLNAGTIRPETLVERLSVGKQQIVAICRALTKHAKIIIFDEPTSALSDSEVNTLFSIIRNLKEQGVTCVYISHKLNRILEISDSITVLRDGKSIISGPRNDFDEQILITHMVGRELEKKYPRCSHTAGKVVLEVRDFSVVDPSIPKTLVDHVSFSVRIGEILGFAGLMGAGRTELFMALFGAYDDYEITGEVYLNGELLSIKTPRDAIRRGIGLVVENRKEHGLVSCMHIINNSILANIPNMVSSFGMIDENLAIKQTEKYAQEFSLRYSSLEQLVSSLSGGNQQKVVITKSLMPNPKVLIMDEPTRGIDVKAKYDIYNIMNKLIDEGVAIVMVSSELPEILGMADRIIVMCEGKLTGELFYHDATQEKIMEYATKIKE
jgi:D-xylose transport system ATP-binding protein